jgi:hypothetical protein
LVEGIDEIEFRLREKVEVRKKGKQPEEISQFFWKDR